MTQRQWIENARRATDARPVILNKIPRWAQQAIRRAYRTEGTRFRCSPAMAILNDSRWSGLLDHWGASTTACCGRSDVPTFCTEPYASRLHIEMALRFADWLGCVVEIGGASWWFPSRTVRIEFRQRDEDLR